MRRNRAMVWAMACGVLFATGAAVIGQSTGSGDPPRRDAPPPIRRTTVPLPQRDPPPLGSTDRLPDAPPPRERVGNSSRPRAPQPGGSSDGSARDPDAIDHARDLEDDARRRHGLGGSDDVGPPAGDDEHRDRRRHRRRVPVYYDPWPYDRNRYWDDGFPGYDPEPLADDPRDRRPGDDDDRPDDGPLPPGALLPPEGMIDDEDLPAPLRKALEASPQHREATAQLLRAWATYARSAEQVLQRLRLTTPYRRAMAQLRDAEAKVAAVRSREAGAPAERLVTAAQQAMLARRAVRKLEEQAINADPLARRAKEHVDQAIERRNKIRDDIAGKLPDLGKPDAAPKAE